MGKADKVFWIGDEGDNKSVLISRKVYERGQEIPAGNVPVALLEAWEAAGLISVGENRAPVVIKDTGTTKALEAEIRSLKTDLDSLPGLQKQNEELKAALEKAKSGKKADKVKELEGNLETAMKRADDLESDNKEKAARIAELEVQVEELTAPEGGSDTESGGPV
jgi:hypothetical protein